jgi:hypothetical protein
VGLGDILRLCLQNATQVFKKATLKPTENLPFDMLRACKNLQRFTKIFKKEPWISKNQDGIGKKMMVFTNNFNKILTAEDPPSPKGYGGQAAEATENF